MSMANTGALTRPAQKVVGASASRRRSVNCGSGMCRLTQRQQSAAGQAHGVGDHGQQRQRDDERQHPRHHQQFDRIHAHGAQRVGFLVELHDADLGGKGAAGTAGDDDGGQQHAHFAQHRNGHQVDHEDVGAEPRQLLRAEIGHDHADEKCDQRRRSEWR